MLSLRDIKRRIRSIRNTQQITKAMEMVAAAKMRKAQEAALKSRDYAESALQLLSELGEKTEKKLHFLLKENETKKILNILITTDKGLCGGLNTNILNEAMRFAEEEKKSGYQLDWLCVGKKGRDFIQRNRFKIIAEFCDLKDKVDILDITSIAQIPLDSYKERSYGGVYLIYNDFVSTLVQKPKVRQLLPLTRKEMIKITELGKNIEVRKRVDKKETEKVSSYEYIFEPSPKEVLNVLLPRLVEMQIYQAVLESKASEHSARMVAMKNATDNAKELIEDLTLTFNQARQAVITKEITEISAGKAALED